MNSYERVKRAIEFKCPDRVPLRFWRLECTDTAESGYKSLEEISRDEVRKRGLKKFIDEWGCVWTLSDFHGKIHRSFLITVLLFLRIINFGLTVLVYLRFLISLLLREVHPMV